MDNSKLYKRQFIKFCPLFNWLTFVWLQPFPVVLALSLSVLLTNKQEELPESRLEGWKQQWDSQQQEGCKPTKISYLQDGENLRIRKTTDMGPAILGSGWVPEYHRDYGKTQPNKSLTLIQLTGQSPLWLTQATCVGQALSQMCYKAGARQHKKCCVMQAAVSTQ